MKKFILLITLLSFNCVAKDNLICGTNDSFETCMIKFTNKYKSLPTDVEQAKKLCETEKEAFFCAYTAELIEELATQEHMQATVENIKKGIKDRPKLSKADTTAYDKKVIEYGENACNKGNLFYCSLVYNSYTNLKDIAKARKYAQKVCLAQYAEQSCNDLLDLYQNESYLSGDELKFVQAAKNNDKQTVKKLNTKLCPQNALACQSAGLDLLEQNPQQAYKYLNQACDLGIADACVEAAMVNTGQNSLKNRLLSYEKACNYGFFQGGIEPCFYAGLYFSCGIGVDKNLKKAENYLKKACLRGYANMNSRDCNNEIKKLSKELTAQQCKELVK